MKLYYKNNLEHSTKKNITKYNRYKEPFYIVKCIDPGKNLEKHKNYLVIKVSCEIGWWTSETHDLYKLINDKGNVVQMSTKRFLKIKKVKL